MCMVFYTVQFSLPIFIVFNKDKETAKIWPPATNGSFPLSGTGQYSTVRLGVAQLAFPLPTVPLLDRRGVFQKLANDNKARQ